MSLHARACSFHRDAMMQWPADAAPTMQVRADFIQSFKKHCIKGSEHWRGAVAEVSAATASACCARRRLMHLYRSYKALGKRACLEPS